MACLAVAMHRQRTGTPSRHRAGIHAKLPEVMKQGAADG
jgi:hypothetical protein